MAPEEIDSSSSASSGKLKQRSRSHAPSQTVSAVKTPPPEKPEAVWLRSRVILSFWLVVTLFGVPMWWQTTSIYRARLPIQEMLDWNGEKTPYPILPLDVWIVAPLIPCEDARQLIQTAQSELDAQPTLEAQPIRIRLAKSKGMKKGKGSQSATDPECFLQEYGTQEANPALELHYSPDETISESKLVFDLTEAKAEIKYGKKDTATIGSFTAKVLRDTFAEEQAATAHKLASHGNAQAISYMGTVPETLRSTVIAQENRALKYASTYHLTFSLFTPGGSPSSWAIEDALKSYIRPWTTALSAISNFTIDTQVQPYSSYAPSVQTIKSADSNGTLLRRDDLSAFINTAEWPLSPSIGARGPTIHFVLYVPSAGEVPLTIASTAGETSWLIPQWGGVTILNPTLVPSPLTGRPSIPTSLSLEALRPAFHTITTQLLSLIGPAPSPSLPSSSSSPASTLPLPMRLAQLTLHLTLSLHLQTRSTLPSLAHLSLSLSSIPIPLPVAQLVSSTLQHLHSTTASLSLARWDEALHHARAAWEDSERAFFEKSMVGQVYFPDEHKIAVYLPLLGPVGVPLLVALLAEGRRIVAAWKQRRKGG